MDAFEDSDNALHWAAFWGDREIGQLLLEAGADMSLTNRFGDTPIQDAYRSNNREMSLLLTKWQKKGTAHVVAMKRRVMEWAVQKNEVNSLKEFCDAERDDFLMKIHVDTAEAEIAKILVRRLRPNPIPNPNLSSRIAWLKLLLRSHALTGPFCSSLSMF